MLHEGHCINKSAVLVASGAVSVFSDLLRAYCSASGQPGAYMWLQKRRIPIIAVFATGTL